MLQKVTASHEIISLLDKLNLQRIDFVRVDMSQPMQDKLLVLLLHRISIAQRMDELFVCQEE